MSKILKTTFSVVNDNERDKSIVEEMGKYILINDSIKLKVSVDYAWKTFLCFLLNEYSQKIEFLPKTSFDSVTKRIGKVTYLINDISFKKKSLELDYFLGVDEYNVIYIFKKNGSGTIIKIRHIAMIGDYVWSLSSTFGKFDYKKEYKSQVNQIKKALEYYISKNKILSDTEYLKIEDTFNSFINKKYKVDELKSRLVELMTKKELSLAEKKEVKKINKLLKQVGFL